MLRYYHNILNIMGFFILSLDFAEQEVGLTVGFDQKIAL